jgi:urease accessory protein
MIIKEIIGNLKDFQEERLIVDPFELEWFDTNKRVLRKKSKGGTELALRFLNEGKQLKEGDILFRNGDKVIAVQILPCEAIVFSPNSLLEMGTICYEIGNKHLPLFIQEDEILVPYEDPLFRWLTVSGYQPRKEVKKLTNMLKSTVSPHRHGDEMSSSFFNKVISMASKI